MLILEQKMDWDGYFQFASTRKLSTKSCIFKVKVDSMYLQSMIHHTIVSCSQPMSSQRTKPLMNSWRIFAQMN